MDEEYGEYAPTPSPARLNWTDPLVLAVAFFRGVAYAAGETADLALIMLAQHSQLILNRQRFRESIGRDIESLTGRSDA